MVDIGTSDKITNLWPTPPGRPIKKSGLKDPSSKKQQQNKNHKNRDELKDDGPGKNIDEYA